VVTKKFKENFLKNVAESRDEDISTPFNRREPWVSEIRFDDVMNTVLMCIPKQKNAKNILMRVSPSDFCEIIEIEWDRWLRNLEDEFSKNLWGAYTPGPGPMGGTASTAERYFHHFPGPYGYETLSLFFFYPKNWPGKGGWPLYEKHVKAEVFCKWRRPQNLKHLDRVFELADMIFEEMLICANKAEKKF